MAAAVAHRPQPPPQDDLDALFSFDAGIEEALKSTGRDENASRNAQPGTHEDNAQHVDQEVTITKKRTPIAKLDEDRILGPSGIPKLRKIVKRMKYKGKGHEFSDMTRVLNMYQLWLDDMYPRAKFGDALIMVEKLGHKKRIQMHRREWIDEGKATIADLETEETRDTAAEAVIESSPSEPVVAMAGALPDAHFESGSADDQQLPDDELDALLAEEAQMHKTSRNEDDSFADDEEAMAGMGW